MDVTPLAAALLTASLVWKRRARLLAVSGLGILLVFGSGMIGGRAMDAWENATPFTLPEDAPTAAAIAVAGGDYNRVRFAAQLYKAGKAPWILLSYNGVDAGGVRAYLAEFGVPESAFQIEERSTTTYENALYSAPILKARAAARFLLVTSAHHMPRAAAAYRKQGLHPIPAPVYGRAWEVIDQPWPSAYTLWLSDRLLHELGGMAYYKLRGWI